MIAGVFEELSYPLGARVHMLPLQQAATVVAGLLRARCSITAPHAHSLH